MSALSRDSSTACGYHDSATARLERASYNFGSTSETGRASVQVTTLPCKKTALEGDSTPSYARASKHLTLAELSSLSAAGTVLALQGVCLSLRLVTHGAKCRASAQKYAQTPSFGPAAESAPSGKSLSSLKRSS
jgi:hypothetical protein